MKRFIAALIGLGLLAIPKTTGKIEDNLENKVRTEVTAAMIQPEMRRWGSQFVSDYFESDFTDGRKTKPIGLDITNLESDDNLHPYSTTYARFDNDRGMVLFPLDIGADEVDYFRMVVNHELTHTVLDDDSVTFDTAYSGPKRERLFELARESMNLPENATHVEDFRINSVLNIKYTRVDRKIEVLRKVYGEINDDFNVVVSKVSEQISEFVAFPEREFEYVRQKFTANVDHGYLPQLKKRIDDLDRRFDDAHDIDSSDYAAWESTLDQLNRDIDALVPDFTVVHIPEVYRRILDLELLSRELIGVREHGSRYLDEKDQYHTERIEPNFDTTIFTNEISTNLAIQGLTSLIGFGYIDAAAQKRIGEINEYAKNEDEFIARVIGRVAMVDTGPVGYENPRANQNLLDALRQMRYKGEPIFGNMFERYDVAMDLSQRGHSQTEINRILNGRRYDFTGNDFTIIGTPHVEGSPN